MNYMWPSPSPSHVCFLPAHMIYTCSWMAEWVGESVDLKILWFGALHRIFSSSPLSRSFVFCPPLHLYAFCFRKSYISFRYAYVSFCCKTTKIEEQFCKGKEKSALFEAVVWGHRYNHANNNWGLITSRINIASSNSMSITYCGVGRGEKELGIKKKSTGKIPHNFVILLLLPGKLTLLTLFPEDFNSVFLNILDENYFLYYLHLVADKQLETHALWAKQKLCKELV